MSLAYQLVFISSLLLHSAAFSQRSAGLGAFRTIQQSVRPSASLKAVSPESWSFMTSLLQQVNPDQARSEFFFFFFGGSGALGIGFAQVPKLLAESSKVKALGGKASRGGADFDITPLATLGYPESLKLADVEEIIKLCPSVEDIYKKGPKKSYLAQRGFIEREGFDAIFPKSNPLALYAAFDAIAKGGGDLCTPTDAAEVIASWKSGGIDAFKSTLLTATLRKYSAYVAFFFLIALVLDLIVESGINAFL